MDSFPSVGVEEYFHTHFKNMHETCVGVWSVHNYILWQYSMDRFPSVGVEEYLCTPFKNICEAVDL